MHKANQRGSPGSHLSPAKLLSPISTTVHASEDRMLVALMSVGWPPALALPCEMDVEKRSRDT